MQLPATMSWKTKITVQTWEALIIFHQEQMPAYCSTSTKHYLCRMQPLQHFWQKQRGMFVWWGGIAVPSHVTDPDWVQVPTKGGVLVFVCTFCFGFNLSTKLSQDTHISFVNCNKLLRVESSACRINCPPAPFKWTNRDLDTSAQ